MSYVLIIVVVALIYYVDRQEEKLATANAEIERLQKEVKFYLELANREAMLRLKNDK